MALQRSVSFPWGAMVTYVTWDVLLREFELRRNVRGMRYPRHQTCKSLPSVEEHSYVNRTEEPGLAHKSLSIT